jgi:tetratricopeptide (TPR) repeat protein
MLSLKTSGALFVAALLLESCAFTPQGMRPAGQYGQLGTIIEEGQALLSRHEYAQALILLEDGYRMYGDSDLLESFLAAAQQAKAAGDQSLERMDFARAGMLYRTLQESALLKEAAGRSNAIDHGLEKQIRECSRMLTERGLKKYREENLGDAIALWEKVLLFDPNNRAVLKAIDTASRQRKRLQSIN